MSNTASLKKEYADRIAPALKSQFQYSSTMQVPVLKKIVINHSISPLENPAQIKQLRRTIARMKTELRQRELNNK